MPAVSPPTPRPTTKATVTPTAATALSKAERALPAQLRVDARVDCRPRRQDLPSGASTGVECYVDTPLVARVGIYGFVGGDDEQLLPGYFSRLSDYGVEPGTGDCLAGTPGDASWPDYLPDEGDGHGD